MLTLARAGAAAVLVGAVAVLGASEIKLRYVEDRLPGVDAPRLRGYFDAWGLLEDENAARPDDDAARTTASPTPCDECARSSRCRDAPAPPARGYARRRA